MEKVHGIVRRSASEEAFGDRVLPALSNGRLYVRTPRELICLKVSAHSLPFLHGIGGCIRGRYRADILELAKPYSASQNVETRDTCVCPSGLR